MNEDSMPLVSIVAPMYNVEKYIDTFIQRILDQTYKNWELILVDDGSTDNTVSVVQTYDDPRIILVHRNRQPKGSTTCRNIGQCMSKGKYLIHFDADDIVMPICLQQRVSFMNDNPKIEFATFKGATVIEKKDGMLEKTNKKWGIPLGNDDLRLFLSTQYPYSVWNNIYRLSSFKDYLWDEKVSIYTDFSYIVPSIIQNKRHKYDEQSEEDYCYRMGRENAMTKSFISNEKYFSTKYLFTKTLNALSEMDNGAEYKKEFYDFFKLQFFRLIMDGTYSQFVDFYRFSLEAYAEKYNLPFRLAYLLLNPYLKKEQRVLNNYVKLVSYLALQPSTMLKWLKAKVYNQDKGD